MKEVLAEPYVKGKCFFLIDVIRLIGEKFEILAINSSRDLAEGWRKHQELSTEERGA